MASIPAQGLVLPHDERLRPGRDQSRCLLAHRLVCSVAEQTFSTRVVGRNGPSSAVEMMECSVAPSRTLSSWAASMIASAHGRAGGAHPCARRGIPGPRSATTAGRGASHRARRRAGRSAAGRMKTRPVAPAERSTSARLPNKATHMTGRMTSGVSQDPDPPVPSCATAMTMKKISGRCGGSLRRSSL